MCSLEELSNHCQKRGFRPICDGETREEYAREFGAWLAERLTIAPEVLGRLNGEWKVGVRKGIPIVYTGIMDVEGWQLVCKPNHLPNSDDSVETVANMIAAAPNLWMACRGILRVLKSGPPVDEAFCPTEELVEAMQEIEEALAKADGGKA
jgi:hypothetical protein